MAFQVCIFKVGVQTVVPCGTTFPSQFGFIITEDVIVYNNRKLHLPQGPRTGGDHPNMILGIIDLVCYLGSYLFIFVLVFIYVLYVSKHLFIYLCVNSFVCLSIDVCICLFLI